jgi:hypothetical protein
MVLVNVLDQRGSVPRFSLNSPRAPILFQPQIKHQGSSHSSNDNFVIISRGDLDAICRNINRTAICSVGCNYRVSL